MTQLRRLEADLCIERAVQPPGGTRAEAKATGRHLGGGEGDRRHAGGGEGDARPRKGAQSGIDHDRGMGSRTRPGDAAAAAAKRAGEAMGEELRDARIGAGLSLADAGTAAGLSASQLSRMERGAIERVTIEQLWRAGAALGLRGHAKYYPAGSPVRDRAHLALLARFEQRLRPPLQLRREVPMPIEGDLRAWDGMVRGATNPFFSEGETHLGDVQALERRLRQKLRDDPRSDLLVLVVMRSEHNRAVLRDHREVLRDLLPLDGGAVLRALADGRPPAASGIVVL
jgi:transcriptional regulator with XRE-family HTH domain